MFFRDVVSDTTPEVVRLAHSIDASDTSDRSPASASPPTHGHVLLTSLPRVSALARQRALLLHETRRSSSSAGAGGEFGAVLVRLVLSLLSASPAESVVPSSSTTSADDATADPLLSAVHSSSEVDVAVQLLPWASVGALNSATTDVDLRGVCCRDEQGTSADDGCFSCRVVLMSHPVAVFSSDTTRALAHHWRSTAPASSEAETEGSAAAVQDATAAAPCLATAMDEFHACVRLHELRSLHAVAEVCEHLLCCLARPEQTPVEVTIPVPLYGAVLDVEDNQTTRLKRVGHLTTPLLRAATGEASPLRPLTLALQQLRAWCVRPDAGDDEAPTLCLTQRRLGQLLAFVSRFAESLQHSGLSASSAGALDVSQQCAADLLLPASLVHCQLGVSRSPSVVLLFYADAFKAQWRRAALRRTQQAAAAENASVNGVAANELTTRIDPAEAVEVFYALRNALVRARPRVKPNVCFTVQLLSLWKRSIVSEESG